MKAKQYISENRPNVALALIAFFFFSMMLTLASESSYCFFLLQPSNLLEPDQWYRFITYPLNMEGTIWLQVSIRLYLTGLILEQYLSRMESITLVLLCTIIGGIVYSFFHLGDPQNPGVGSPTLISWCYSICALTLIIRHYNKTNLFEKIVGIIVILSLIEIVYQDTGSLLRRILIAAIAVSYGLKFGQKKSNTRAKTI